MTNVMAPLRPTRTLRLMEDSMNGTSTRCSSIPTRAARVALACTALALGTGDALAQGFDVWQTLWGPGRKSSGELFRSAADPAPSDAFTFGSGQNSIAIGGQYFTRIESRANADFNALLKDNDTFVEHRARMSLRASLAGVLGMVLEYQDVRIWGTERNTVTTEPFTGLHQGFVDLRPAKWLNLRVGRQELSYGEDRLIGSLDWAQSARAFDGLFVRLQLMPNLTADLFAMDVKERIVLVDPANAQNKVPNEGSQFYGIYTRWRPNQLFGVDVYALGLVQDPSTLVTGPRGERAFATLGGRAFASGGGLSVTLEGAYQVGSDLVGDLSAYALAAKAIYTLPMRWSPYVGFEYTRASGDGNATDKTNNTFNQLFPTGHLFMGYMDYVGWQNVQAWRATVGVRPKPGAHIWLDVHRFEMLEAKDAWYSASGARFIDADPRRKHVVMGNEVNLSVTWPLHKHVSLAGSYGLFMPGDAATRAQSSTIGRGGVDAITGLRTSDVSHWGFLYLRSQF